MGTSEPIKDDAETCNPTKSVCDRYIFNTVITRARSLVVSVGNPFLLLKTEKHMIKKYGETGRCWTEYLKSCLQHGTLDVSIEPEKYKQQKCLARLKELVCTPVKTASKSSNLTQNPQSQPPKHKQCTAMSASVPSGAVRLPENTPSLRTLTQRAMPTTELAANKMPSANSGNRTLYFAYNYSLLCYCVTIAHPAGQRLCDFPVSYNLFLVTYLLCNVNETLIYHCIYFIEYGSTLYVGMARKKMAAVCTLYKLLRSELCSRCSHKPL